MSKYRIIPIFPSPVYESDLDEDILLNALPNLRKKIDENTLDKTMEYYNKNYYDRYILENKDYKGSEEQFISEHTEFVEFKERYILEYPEFSELKKHLQDHIDFYTKNVIGEKNNRFRLYITMSWCTGLLPGVSHPEHNHVNSIISGVFFFDNPENASPFTITKMNDSTLIYLNPSHPSKYTSNVEYFEPKNGKLLLFPSYLKHKVPPNETNVKRQSVAFDTFVEGEIGSCRNILKLSKVPQKG